MKGREAHLRTLRLYLERSERRKVDDVLSAQQKDLAVLAEHAYGNSSFWRNRLHDAGFPTSREWFASLPILTRSEVQTGGDELVAPPPKSHGQVYSGKTSGSTGQPLIYFKTEAALLFWHAITLRNSLWHGRDMNAKLATIRVGSAQATHQNWGPAFFSYSGSTVSFDARKDVAEQAAWLLEEQPQYLLTHASNLQALAQHFLANGLALGSLREAQSYSEQLPGDLRLLAKEAWGVAVTDMYSTNEAGYLALQCPASKQYHIQSEDVLVEIVDDTGKPCPPGAVGRVITTPLHNFAMPLLRYDTGDYAELGGPCPCGRTLPTLANIRGRTRNMMRLPGGGRGWPGWPNGILIRTAVRQCKMIQHSLEEIEVQLVVDRPLSAAEEEELRKEIQLRLQHPFEVRLTRVDRIEPTSGHKFEDFECRVV